MRTNLKEQCIGKVIGGYLEDSYIFIYNSDYIVIVKNRKIICYVNGDTVIEYLDKLQTQKKKLGSSIVGGLLFGTAGTLAFGNQNDYVLEITWNNGKKSLIKIEGEQFYTFFVSKLYEKAPIKTKSKEEIIKEQNETLDKKIAKCNLKLENESLDDATSLLLQTIPYYKFRFNKCNILDYNYKIDEFSKDICKYNEFLKNNNLNNLNNYQDYLKKYDAIIKLKMIKSGNLLAKKIYENDHSLKIITDEEYEKYKDYDKDTLKIVLEQAYEKEIYEKQKDLYEKNGYICFSNDKEIQKKQLINIKDKLPNEIYTFLLKIIDTDKEQITLTFSNSSYYIISKIANSFFGKYDLTDYGYDNGLLQIITISPKVKKYLDKLIEIGNNNQLEKSYFDSLNVDEHESYFKAMDIYNDKYVLKQNIEVKVDNSLSHENLKFKEEKQFQNLCDKENLIKSTNTYQLLKTDDKWKMIEHYLKESNTANLNLKSYCPLKAGGIVITNSFTAYYLKCKYLPKIQISFDKDWSEQEKQTFIETNKINKSLMSLELYPDVKKFFENFKEEDEVLFNTNEILQNVTNKQNMIDYLTKNSNTITLNPNYLKQAIELLGIKEENFIGRFYDNKIYISNEIKEVALINIIKKY